MLAARGSRVRVWGAVCWAWLLGGSVFGVFFCFPLNPPTGYGCCCGFLDFDLKFFGKCMEFSIAPTASCSLFEEGAVQHPGQVLIQQWGIQLTSEWVPDPLNIMVGIHVHQPLRWYPIKKLEDDWPESIFPQVLIQLWGHLFTSLRRACLRAAMLSVYCYMRAPSHHPTFLSNCAARFLTKVVCASCIVPGCCAQVALCKLLRASALCKLLCASALSKLLCASALRQLLRASALRMCSVQVGLCKLLCACSVQVALRKCSEQVALRKGSAPVAPCKGFAHVLCASWSVQVALRKCFVQFLCASCSAQVALRK